MVRIGHRWKSGKLTPPEANRSARFLLLAISSSSTGTGDRGLFLPGETVVDVTAVAVLALLAPGAVVGIPKRAARASILAASC